MTGPVTKYEMLLEREVWRSLIHEAALLSGSDPAFRERQLGWSRERPTRGEIGRLRDILRAPLQAPETQEQLGQWVRGKSEVPPPFAAACESGDGLWARLEGALGGRFSNGWPVFSSARMEALKRELRCEAMAALLLHAVRAHERAGGGD
jgi:hypothetical protein